MKKSLLALLITLVVSTPSIAKDGVLAVEINSNISLMNDDGKPSTTGSGTCVAYPKTDDAKFAAMLQNVTGGDKSAKVIFYDTALPCSAELWASVKAQKLGYTKAASRRSKLYVCETMSFCMVKILSKNALNLFSNNIFSAKSKTTGNGAFSSRMENGMTDPDMQNPVAHYDW